ncbi:trypsin-like peptidase domain-containing protein [Fodinibius sediminis]|uniref:NACHT domain-containing protein n=1 Tax=Fodinibius sediminis TaxID=1214077 RepID=A0A521ASL4_9BACT|nr:trypsin-like peptidase domain-containing protein [Fodinibius sediminis]SMO37812.1 NACHT domain-containing protein [Fodinibius sediminis]
MKKSIVNPTQVEKATLRIICGNEYGTGFLISDDTLITASHVILNHIEDEEVIKVEVLDEGNGEGIQLEGDLIEYDSEADVAVIKLDQSFKKFLPLKISEIRYESIWKGYGYPYNATDGGWFKGAVKQQNQSKPYDVELQCSNYDLDTDYNGLSGAPLVIEDKVVGILTWSIVDGFGAISISKIESFLASQGIKFEREKNINELPDELIEELEDIASNENVITLLQEKLNTGGQYYLLHGSPGSGKTIVSASLPLHEKDSEIVGKYFIGKPNDQKPKSQVISKESFIGWLEDLISKKLTGKAYPKQTKNFNERIEAFSRLLDELNQYYIDRNKIGFILIDGLDEVANAKNVDLEDYLGVFPETLPSNISILFSATREELLPNFIKSRLLDKNKIHVTPIPIESRINYLRKHLENQNIELPIENIHAIAEKSEGHPLYLRYILEILKKEKPSNIEGWLDGLPKLNGDISNYYEKIWDNDLTNDSDKFWIILTVSQLRHPVKAELLIKMLPEEAKQAFSIKKESIQHLLRDNLQISIYHNSFTLFLEAKASESVSSANENISNFCEDNEDLEYAISNKVFHRLNSKNPQKAVIDCNQEWADKCAFINVEPDLVLKDIKDTEIYSIESGLVTELIRIKLLLQRTRFRYNNVLAENAFHIADLLLGLSQPSDALKYILRGELLLVSDDDAIYFLQKFYESEAFEQAKKLQSAIRKKYQFLIEKEAKENGFKFSTILLHLKATTLLFNRDPEQSAGEFQNRMQLLKRLKDADERNVESITHLREYASAWNMGYMTWRFNRYPGLLAVQKLSNVDIDEKWTRHFAMMPAFYDQFKRNVNSSEDSSTYWELIKDVEHLTEYYGVAESDLPIVIGTLIEDSDRVDIVTELISRIELNNNLSIRAENGVDVNLQEINFTIEECKYEGYLNIQDSLPKIENFSSYNWEANLISIIQFLGQLFGKAHRYNAEGQISQLNSLEESIDNLIEKLDFSLSERAHWDRSYAIPEGILPIIYGHLTEFILKFFPDKTTSFVQNVIERGKGGQLGLYTEGYRQCLYSITEETSRYTHKYLVTTKILKILETHILNAVQNRWERVPELLRLAELYSRIGNDDKAEEIYCKMLDSSMGPTWYKEDQFTLINSILSLDLANNSSKTHFKQFAGYLDYASGELTFQRYVRYEKESLINSLVKAGHVPLAIQYFKYQVLPDPVTIIENAESSTVDALDEGQGYVLGARSIVEANGIIQLLKNIEADPIIVWSIVEAVIINDETFRYLRSFTKIQSQCLVHSSLSNDEKEMLHQRLVNIITDEDMVDNQANYLKELKTYLSEDDRKILQGNLIKEGIDFNFSKETVKSFNREELSEEEREKYDDFRLPGMGKDFHIDLNYLEDCINEASIEISAENFTKARAILSKGLKQLHSHKSDIWKGGNLANILGKAFDLLPQTGNAEEITQSLKEPISNHFTNDWIVVDQLIEILSHNTSHEETEEILNAIKDHFDIMIQCDDEVIKKYDWMEKETAARDNINFQLVEFLIWLLNHPHSSVKKRVIDSLKLLGTYRPEQTIPLLFGTALSNKPEFSTELSAFVLSRIANENPDIIWHYLQGRSDIQEKIVNLTHFTIKYYFKEVVVPINSESDEAKQFYNELLETIPSNVILEGRIELDEPNLWPAEHTLERLNEIQILNDSFYDTLLKKIKKYSDPIEPSDQLKVRSYINRSFHDQDVHFGSYDYLLRYAINDSIIERVSQSDYEEVTEILKLPFTDGT